MTFRMIEKYTTGRRAKLSPVRLSVSGKRILIAIDLWLCETIGWRAGLPILLHVGDGEDDGLVRLESGPNGFTLYGHTQVCHLKCPAWGAIPEEHLSSVPLEYGVLKSTKALMLTMPWRKSE